MSDPRLMVDFTDLDSHITTMKTSRLEATDAPTGGVNSNYGTVVAVTTNANVEVGEAGDRIFGQVVTYTDGGYVGVRDRGYMTAFYTGSAPTVGGGVECDGSGYVRAATSTNIGGNTTVVSVDETAGTVTFKLS